MGLAQYAIVPVQDEWGVLHDATSTANTPPRNRRSKRRWPQRRWRFGRAMRFMSACRVDSQMKPRLEAKARDLLGKRRI